MSREIFVVNLLPDIDYLVKNFNYGYMISRSKSNIIDKYPVNIDDDEVSKIDFSDFDLLYCLCQHIFDEHLLFLNRGSTDITTIISYSHYNVIIKYKYNIDGNVDVKIHRSSFMLKDYGTISYQY